MADMQFLVTMSSQPGERLGPDKMANRIASILLACPEVCCAGMVERSMSIIPLPDLAADDTDLQIGFRRLTSGWCTWGADHGMGTKVPLDLTRGQITALVTELTKQRPGHTNQVDLAALEAMRAIRSSDERPGPPVQKNARVQMIIIDAICRCMPEEGK